MHGIRLNLAPFANFLLSTSYSRLPITPKGD